ncbi:hypothetical protein [Leifsonia sp. fls2-241-R2A-40a]|uniref:hypothetical protein n=1 Tax=Leifsonia sp. fls2-241-R2A-40a TaxID=3040290 RepID=UPI00254CCB8B|nr:hypothetical protein [Leifsonia sp. fls2-241-R2A-40a]
MHTIISSRVRSAIARLRSERSTLFTAESGVVDLASIMVGILVIGIIAGVIAATIVGVVPWAQQQAAQSSLRGVVDAQAIARINSGGTYTDSAGLQAAKLLPASDLHVATDASGRCWVATATAAGKTYMAWSGDTNPTILTDGQNTPCAPITAAEETSDPAPTWAVPDAVVAAGVRASLGLDASQPLLLSHAATLADSNDGPLLTAIKGATSGVDLSGLELAKGVTKLGVGAVTLKSENGLGNITSAGTVYFNSVKGAISLPFTSVTSIQVRDGDGVTELSAPALKSVTNVINVTSSAITAIKAPSLSTVGSISALSAATPATALKTLDLSALSTATVGIFLQGTGVTDLSLPSLTQAGSMSLGGASLASLEVPKLTAFDGGPGSAVTIKGTGLASVDFSALTSAEDLYVQQNKSLMSARFPALKSAGYLNFSNNPVLDLGTSGFPALKTLSKAGSMGVTWIASSPTALPITVHDLIKATGIWGYN